MNRLLNILLLALLCGCQTPQMPVIDLEETGWKEKTGQALWYRPGAPRMAVDIHFAKREGGSWLQLSKGGLPMATVTLTPNGWELDGSLFGRKVGARGKPPSRAGPAQLALTLGGQPVGRGWKTQTSADGLILESTKSGERWKVYLDE